MDIRRVKANLHKRVLYNGRVYTLLEYVLWLDTSTKRNQVKHSLILQDTKGNSTIRVLLDKVQEIKEGDINHESQTM